MLAVTDHAASVICHLMTTSPSETAGVRIATVASGDELQLSLVAEPQDGDAVVDAAGGARVFVDKDATSMLDDKALDVRTDSAGEFQFAITPTRR